MYFRIKNSFKISNNQLSLFYRKCSSEVDNYLRQKGFNDAIIDGIIKAFPSKPSLREIEQLGPAGLEALSKSVGRDLERHKGRNDSESDIVSVVVSIPHHKTKLSIQGLVGDTFLQLAEKNPDLKSYLECSCGGIAACSTCHVIVDPIWFSKIPPPEVSELDMVDLAYGVTATSRLGCQIRLDPSLNGLEVSVPSMSHDLYYAP